MTKKRNQYSSQTKFRVSLEAAKGIQTVSEIASKYRVHPTQVSTWKQKLLKGGKTLFEGKSLNPEKEWELKEKELYEQIGRLQMELEWVKKKSAEFS